MPRLEAEEYLRAFVEGEELTCIPMRDGAFCSFSDDHWSDINSSLLASGWYLADGTLSFDELKISALAGEIAAKERRGMFALSCSVPHT
ncbi:MAG: hypothetical protein FD124_2992 [Alphaproteobacteria bacterium]|nr:MAG: hypothetical protein FD160_1438 [Caulobacteraceae bacterium]TPW03498.1 MAG: hypothetical protein FD124_2992 [Alphaproteobacteria bacterium]